MEQIFRRQWRKKQKDLGMRKRSKSGTNGPPLPATYSSKQLPPITSCSSFATSWNDSCPLWSGLGNRFAYGPWRHKNGNIYLLFLLLRFSRKYFQHFFICFTSNWVFISGLGLKVNHYIAPQFLVTCLVYNLLCWSVGRSVWWSPLAVLAFSAFSGVFCITTPS